MIKFSIKRKSLLLSILKSIVISMNDSSYSDLSLHNHEQATSTHLPQQQDTNELGVRLFWRRWFILAVFSTFIILNVFNLTEYFDVEDAFIQFYVSSFKSYPYCR